MRRFLSIAVATALTAGAAFSQELVNEDGGRVRHFVRAPAEGPHIYYEAGAARDRLAQRVLTSRIRVRLDPGTDPARVARDAQVRHLRAVAYAPGYHIVDVPSPDDIPAALARLRATPGVATADALLARWRAKKLTPNDTFFTNQWHLVNKGQVGGTAGIDVRITNVWDTYRGSNIYIAIIDDGLQTLHTDLSANIETNIDFDWNDATSNDPNPTVTADFHGTACAGVAAGRGNNGIGISGAAPLARIVGLRLIAAANTDEDEGEALSHSNSLIQVKSNSWGPGDDGQTLERPGPLAAAALSNGVTTGRGGLGTLYIWAAGNGLESFDNANYDGYANSPYTIAIAAITDDGTQSYYSEPGACIVVTAPSSGGNQDIATTDLLGANGYNKTAPAGELPNTDYTKTFGGTSSATPLVAGIVALMLEARPGLGWRDVQEILLRSAVQNAPSDPDWVTNAAGFRMNHKYGAGLVNAQASVSNALAWTNLGTRVSSALIQSNLAVAIPDNVATGITRTFAMIGAHLRAEHVIVTIDVDHPYRGDVAVTLVSPQGTTSRLSEAHGDGNPDYTNWTFMTVRNWGENSLGTWTLRIADQGALDTGTLRIAGVEVFGTMLSNTPPVLEFIGARQTPIFQPLTFGVSAVPTDGDAVTLAASNLPPGAVFGSTNGAGFFTWVNPQPAGVQTAVFLAVDNDGVATQRVPLTVTPSGIGSNQALVYYDFDGPAGALEQTPQSVATGITGTLFNSYALTPSAETGNPTNAIGETGWNVSDASRYFFFVVQVATGYRAEFAQVTFDDQSPNVFLGPTAWKFRTSRDNFAADVDSGSVHAGGFGANTATLSFTGITGAVTCRISALNASSSLAEWWVDNVRLIGSLALITDDQDGDGLSDHWEMSHFQALTNAGAATDVDGDGFRDHSEFLAGTAPTNALSYLGVTSASNNAGLGTVVRWQSVSNKTYALHRSTNLVAGFSVVVSNLAASPPVNVYTDTAPVAAEVKTYRVLMQ